MIFRVVFDAGKPFEETFNDVESLAVALRDFYDANKGSDYPFDVIVYDENDNNISESQLIQDIIWICICEVVGE